MDLLGEISKWARIYEFQFQFWGPGRNNVFIEKGGIRLTDSGGFDTPDKAIEFALEYVNKQNPSGFKAPVEEVNRCLWCGCKIAEGNDLCGECACEDDCGA